MAAVPVCVFCRRDLPHEKHVTLLEYSRIFGDMHAYDVRVLDKPRVYGVGETAAKEGRVA